MAFVWHKILWLFFGESLLSRGYFLNLHTLGIVNASQPNGLAVPDATMHTVQSTSDVVNLMELGFSNRAVGATALNERSSRSHRFFFHSPVFNYVEKCIVSILKS